MTTLHFDRVLRDFVDLNFARRLEMAETLSPAHVEALCKYWPQAASEIIAVAQLCSPGLRIRLTILLVWVSMDPLAVMS